MSTVAPVVDSPAFASRLRKAPPLPETPAAPVTPSAEGEWGKIRAYARRQLDRFMSLQSKVLRKSDPDDIHDLRVASRRLQQVFDLLYPQPCPREIRKLRRVMRRARRALSEVRNCDVLLTQVQARLKRKRATHRDAWQAVGGFLDEHRSKSFDKALRKFGKMNVPLFYVHTRKLLNGNVAAHPPEASAAGLLHREVSPIFHDRIAQSLESVAQVFHAQVALSHRDQQASVIHGARIATKRLRYLIEVIQEFKVPGAEEVLAWLRDLQQLLGEWHDQVVLEDLMVAMVARPDFIKEHLPLAMEVEKLVLRLRKSKDGLVEKYSEATSDSEKYRRMRNWVAYILSSPSEAFPTS